MDIVILHIKRASYLVYVAGNPMFLQLETVSSNLKDDLLVIFKSRFWKIEILFNLDFAPVDEGLWSLLSIAAIVKRPYRAQ